MERDEFQVEIEDRVITFKFPDDLKFNDILISLRRNDVEDIISKFSLEDLQSYHARTEDKLALWIMDYMQNPHDYILGTMKYNGIERTFPAKVSMRCYMDSKALDTNL